MDSFWSKFETAWNAHDAKTVAALFAEDAAFKFVDGRELKGRDAIKAHYDETFAKMPQDWFHRIESEIETPTGNHGILTIRNPLDEEVITIRFDLVLSSDGMIHSLILTPS